MKWTLIAGGIAATALLVWFVIPEQSAAAYVRGEIQTCLATGEASWRGTCFKNIAEEFMRELSLEGTLAALAEIDDEEGIKQQCHALVHYLGQSAYRESGSLSQTFARCSTKIACGEGCYHGAVEAYIMETGNQLEDATIADICSRDYTGNETNYAACVHGLGHAFMLLEGDDIFRSLPKCDFLAVDDRDECYAGVFMEHVFGAESVDHPSQYIDKKDPMYPCTIVEERYKNMCYSAQVNLMMPSGPDRYRVGAQFCADVPQKYAPACYGTLGGDAILSTDDPREIVAICSIAPSGLAREMCLREAVKFLGHGSAGDPEKMSTVCFVANIEDQSRCFTMVGEMLEEWHPTRRGEQCAVVNARGTREYGWCSGETT
ncbi:MAG: hypothetical protein WA021_03390 [Minisyncoccia bacterium]